MPTMEGEGSAGVGRGGDGVDEAFGGGEAGVEPGCALGRGVWVGPVEDAGVGADGVDGGEVGGGEGAEEEPGGGDCWVLWWWWEERRVRMVGHCWEWEEEGGLLAWCSLTGLRRRRRQQQRWEGCLVRGGIAREGGREEGGVRLSWPV